MTFRASEYSLLVLTCLLTQACATQRQSTTQPQSQPQRQSDNGNQARWTFNARRANGYSIDLIDADPKPGTSLAAGSIVTFKIKARYSMSVAENGRVSLVFQNRTGVVEGTTPQTRANVSGSSGTVELSRAVTVPAQSDRLQLFVPLAPQGLDVTDGEIVILYPVTPSDRTDHAK